MWVFADSTGYTNTYLTRVLLYFSALGAGWAPAILNSPEELDFIRQGQLWFSDDRALPTVNRGTTLTSLTTILEIRVIGFFPKYSIVSFDRHETQRYIKMVISCY